MTNTAIQDVQKQDPGSAYIQLFELVLSSSSSAYFHSGLEADLSTIQFRDRSSPGTIRTYSALPIEINDVAVQSAGATARPTLVVANILSTFGDAYKLLRPVLDPGSWPGLPHPLFLWRTHR